MIILTLYPKSFEGKIHVNNNILNPMELTFDILYRRSGLVQKEKEDSKVKLKH
jgi:hypothetical protein